MMGSLDSSMQFQQVALRLREQRQEVLASNIANADTPGYKARDFNFNQALQAALTNNGGGTEMTQTSSADLAGANQTASGSVALQYRTAQQNTVNGNTVDLDTERNQFTDNALRYEASLTMLTSQIKNMLAVITG